MRRPHTFQPRCHSHFNPRTHVGCDHAGNTFSGVQHQFQSTHPRGVRPSSGGSGRRLSGFQSTHPRGVRPACACSRLAMSLFQSTHPRGVRPITPSLTAICRDFNPRTHVGCDHIVELETEVNSKFQSTHPRGVRQYTIKHVCGHEEISIHAPTWGATSSRSWGWCRASDFNPRTHVGCDGREAALHAPVHISIHAPTWGATSIS